MSSEAASRSIMRLAYVLAAIAAIAVAILATFYEHQFRDVSRRSARANVSDRLEVLRSQLQGAIDADIRLLEGLVAIVGFEPDIGQERFSQIAARVIGAHPEIRCVTAAPDLIVSLIYPLQGREKLLGFDLRDAPQQLEAALQARDLGATVLVGPVDLLTGRRGFLARTPVFVGGEGTEGRFWGVVSSVIDPDSIYRASGLTDPALPVDLVLIGPGVRSGQSEPFFGDPKILGQDPVKVAVALPVGEWEIAAIPKGGWHGPSGLWQLRSLFLLAGVLIVAPILGAAWLVASRQAKLAVIREREAELSRLSWRLEFALAASNVGVWDVDVATDQLIWDERVRTIFGVSDRGGFFCEADWMAVVHPDDRARAREQAETAVARNGKFVSNYRIVRPDGEVRHIRDVAAVYNGADGSKRLVGLVWDVTTDVERQEELDLRRLEAEAATVAKSRFLAAMSHEIRTPLGGVLGLLGLMLEEPLPPKQRERTRIALASAQSLLEILNDILDFSKLEAGRIRVTEENVRVRDLVREVVALMAAGAERKGLSLTRDIADAVPEWIVTDPMRLRQVLTNLVSNATKFTEAGGIRVRVDYAPRGNTGDLRIEVEDSGIGIGQDQRELIFQHFVQADNSVTRRAGGTGLGLAITKQLVELMGGTITASSVVGTGSTFAVCIPARPGSGAAEPEPAGHAASPPQDAVPPMHILLAEDNATNQYLIEACLQRAGHTVEIVGNGAEAVAAAADGGFDAILMDVQMPELDGPAAARAIRALPGDASTVPIIALTASAMPGDRESCFAAGMTDYLAKPIEFWALLEALRRTRAPTETPEEGAPTRRSA